MPNMWKWQNGRCTSSQTNRRLYTQVTVGFRRLLLEWATTSFSSWFLSTWTSECWWKSNLCLWSATSEPDRAELVRCCPLQGLPGLLVLTEPLLTWFKLPVECLVLMGVSRHEAGNTLPLGRCGLPGGSGFPLWSNEGEASESELNGEYTLLKKQKKQKTKHTHQLLILFQFL